MHSTLAYVSPMQFEQDRISNPPRQLVSRLIAEAAKAAPVAGAVVSHISLSSTSVTTTNMNAVGLHAMTGGMITATDAKVATHGQNAFGASAQDAGSAMVLIPP